MSSEIFTEEEINKLPPGEPPAEFDPTTGATIQEGEGAAVPVELGKGLPKPEVKKNEGKGGAGESLKKFASSVGDALTGVAKFLPNKIEEIRSDPAKKRNFIRGLNIMIESSGYDPKMRSPLGKVATGLAKAEKEFTTEELSKLKAKNQPARIRDLKEEGILKLWGDYDKRYREKESTYKSTDTRFSELYKLAERGIDAPTGLIEKLLTPLQKISSELGLGEQYDKLSTSIKGKKSLSELTDDDKVAFKDIFGAATKAGIVGKVKDLYPASDKDIQVLLETMGDIGTNPKALAALVAAEKGAKEIETMGREYASQYAFTAKDVEFEKRGKDYAATKLAQKYKDQVKPETLKALYGDDPDNAKNPFRIINAYYYQQLSPKYEKDLSSFDTYIKTQTSKIESQKNLIIEQQKKLLSK